mgnify:CR=1 FL=1
MSIMKAHFIKLNFVFNYFLGPYCIAGTCEEYKLRCEHLHGSSGLESGHGPRVNCYVKVWISYQSPFSSCFR